uniref:Uncharacterized protein n=1 Tax=Acrobeloides nanus TaxID=290746 RepID=A0A914DPU5_9BILA
HLFETAEKQAKLMEEQGVNFGKEEEIPVTILSDDEIPQQSKTNKIVLDDSQETVMTQLYEVEDYEIEETPNLLTPGGPSEAVPSTSRDPFESDYE